MTIIQSATIRQIQIEWRIIARLRLITFLMFLIDIYVFAAYNLQQRKYTIIPHTWRLHHFICDIFLFGHSAFTYSESIFVVNTVHSLLNNSKRFIHYIFILCLFYLVLNIPSKITTFHLFKLFFVCFIFFLKT